MDTDLQAELIQRQRIEKAEKAREVACVCVRARVCVRVMVGHFCGWIVGVGIGALRLLSTSLLPSSSAPPFPSPNSIPHDIKFSDLI